MEPPFSTNLKEIILIIFLAPNVYLLEIVSILFKKRNISGLKALTEVKLIEHNFLKLQWLPYRKKDTISINLKTLVFQSFLLFLKLINFYYNLQNKYIKINI